MTRRILSEKFNSRTDLYLVFGHYHGCDNCDSIIVTEVNFERKMGYLKRLAGYGDIMNYQLVVKMNYDYRIIASLETKGKIITSSNKSLTNIRRDLQLSPPEMEQLLDNIESGLVPIRTKFTEIVYHSGVIWFD